MEPKRTPLYNEHVRLKGKIVDFFGWNLPVEYSNIKAEHLAVRTHAGIFDVSHMGQIEVKGKGALALVQYLTINDATLIKDGQAQYTAFCRDDGTTIDDVILYRFSNDHFFFVVNAANIEKDFDWVKSHCPQNIELINRSEDFALIALQGPNAEKILQKLCSEKLASLSSFHFLQTSVAKIPEVIVARTGYTGENGFELFCEPQDAPGLWNALLTAGKELGILPCGLAARDTLRLEAALCLYGHELDDNTTPLEAGLGWVTKLNTVDEFIGKEALVDSKEKGLSKKLVGFTLVDKGIPREGYAIVNGDEQIGKVTSGTLSPTLNIPIGLGFVKTEFAKVGTHFSIDIRGKLKEAKVVKLPFYKKK